MDTTTPVPISVQWPSRTLPGMQTYTKVFIAVNIGVFLLISADRLRHVRSLRAIHDIDVAADARRKLLSERIHRADDRLFQLFFFNALNFVLVNIAEACFSLTQLDMFKGDMLGSSTPASIWSVIFGFAMCGIGYYVFIKKYWKMLAWLQRKVLDACVTWLVRKGDRGPMRHYLPTFRYISGTINASWLAFIVVGEISWPPMIDDPSEWHTWLRLFVLLSAYSISFFWIEVAGAFLSHACPFTSEITDRNIANCPEDMRYILNMFREVGDEVAILDEKEKLVSY